MKPHAKDWIRNPGDPVAPARHGGMVATEGSTADGVSRCARPPREDATDTSLDRPEEAAYRRSKSGPPSVGRDITATDARFGNVLDSVSAIRREFQVASLRPQIEACRGLLVEETGIDVAVMGGFKAGKSSFLNSLAGASVLPVGVVPVTAVITRLCYCPREEAIVYYEDGRCVG